MRSTFVERPHRFLIRAALHGDVVDAACGDPGRLRELLQPGVPLLLAPATGLGRRTRYTALLARQRSAWVSVLPVLANRLFAEALAADRVPGLSGFTVLRREVRHGASRFDFLLQDPRGGAVLTEVKSVSLVHGRRALFPDAPTARGVRHIRELIAHRRGGGRAMLAFVVQRNDADSMSPHAILDPDLAEAVVAARREGVRLGAYACRMTSTGARLEREIPVVIP